MKIRTKKYSADIPRDVAFDGDLSLAALGLYTFLQFAEKPEELTAEGIAFARRQHLDDVKQALNMLESYGYIEL